MMSMLSNVSMGRPCGMSSRSAAPRRGLVARPAIGNPETEGKRQVSNHQSFLLIGRRAALQAARGSGAQEAITHALVLTSPAWIQSTPLKPRSQYLLLRRL